ncbi:MULTISPECIES: efflux transporter outer membrane subunit [Mesoflavibacter]|mgnify:CR=1 FL=1|uniref:Efflux transporter outer membrane subunit n=1 Tax=Mesoflavibacter profundi TaxID=2708110 RepID=A0ABT4S1Z3_9FLAO|nr:MULTISPECIES: efflux transporter outer membrane subunit [Mesoflavibacter]MDA0178072.1 efflux transporter outer membrane subunit [Mesoflavibacter profundi]QIJ89033.1 Efflux transport system, outer membrane factor (OMF) lipoprotein [Mesoflavibacter sp. HG96]QIJ91761.1 Efflux transport system, outer membrane factor (OMF) lipoprotein [Mesoflavibacter sp. HG37]
MKSNITLKKISKPILLILIAFTIQSCFVAKDYSRPEFEETNNLYRTDQLPEDSLSLADISWKQLFTDQYLQQYIEEGLQNNIDIRIAIQQIIAAEAYVKQGKAGFLPTITGNASATRSYLSENGQQGAILSSLGTDHIDQFELSAALSWEADIWGKIRSNKRAFQASYLQSVAAHQAVKTQLIASIASTYYQLIALDEQLKVTRETIKTREKGVETIQALKEAGQENQVAVDQNIAQYNNAKALEVDLEVAIFQAENTLSLLLGKSPQHFDRNSLDNQTIDNELKLGLPATILRNRPDVMAAEFGLIQTFELTNVAKSNFYPSLTLSATSGLQSLDIDKLFNTSSLFANLVGGIAQPILNGRQIKTQHEVAKAQQEQALLTFKQTLLNAGNEVSNALYSYQAEVKKYEFVNNEVEALRKAEANSDELLKNGFANYLDLLTARQSVLTAELSVIDNKLQQLLSVVTLYEALGGGWK